MCKTVISRAFVPVNLRLAYRSVNNIIFKPVLFEDAAWKCYEKRYFLKTKFLNKYHFNLH